MPISIKRQKGFTIVELLIVIVVIGILAAITVATYNGVQQKARNTTTINAVGAYVKLINLYMTGEGSYPHTSGNTCLQIVAGSCSARNATLDARLEKYGALPSSPVYSYIAYYYQVQTVDGKSSPLTLRYLLDGINQDCGVANVVKEASAGIYTTSAAAPHNTVPDSGGRTTCYVHIPFAG